MQPDRDTTDQQTTELTPPEVSPQEPAVARTPVVTMAPDNPTSDPLQMMTDPMTMSQDQEPVAAKEPISQPTNDELVRWQAAEYIHHEKGALWFTLFAVVVVLMMAVSIFLVKEITFTILIPVMAAALVVYARRPPRMIDYTLSRQGLHINDQLYPFADFKGFGVIHDGKEFSVMLIPVKRFRAGVSVYFPEESGEAIVDILGTRLPMQELHLDMFDRIIHKLRL